ncbi:hypothetical protein F0U60_17350 [Archangium minus]|uniref:Uncharacterized protein n=1 Tax=Archangium minus TaxID=83450 RepID=A0ABY9WSD2_9BACT|nr:hypothetical protein F0U61_17190 [Archangium violaceum]WNG35202.1 hypothetical protein F0U61_17205 [Archangium violaceum]WNG35206.1 hypothetical protein F0U61_17230 [Archangium violaceum]WNG45666.1 hypothetical protein F0U60_17325 [Archangium minus]WNG45671.1 hypothetical protein F0U60_17350 [Archangium minus]
MSTVNNAATSALNKALSNSNTYSTEENNLLSKLSGPDRDRMEAQLALQKQQETVAFISNMMKKLNEIAMSVINNLK